MILIYKKAKKRIWSEIVSRLRDTSCYTYIYKSYWHYLLFPNHKQREVDPIYFTARPNPGAGIGHQMANWIAGYWFAKQFGLKFAHLPFSNTEWEDVLGFGYDEPQVQDLLNQGYKLVRLPLFSEDNQTEIDLVKAIISSYSGKKVIFRCEQDQFYKDQFGVISEIQRKFYNAPSRNNDDIRYNKHMFNIAVHVRRTVIIENKVIFEDEENKAKRWLSNTYYEEVLKQVLMNINVNKPIAIWLFTTGNSEEFSEFSSFGQINFCSDMDEYQSFVHLVNADLLITSKSSFSYKPALLNRGIKVCPSNFWHSYPSTNDWILCDNDGSFDINRLNETCI